jgi:hypothetical protein
MHQRPSRSGSPAMQRRLSRSGPPAAAHPQRPCSSGPNESPCISGPPAAALPLSNGGSPAAALPHQPSRSGPPAAALPQRLSPSRLASAALPQRPSRSGPPAVTLLQRPSRSGPPAAALPQRRSRRGPPGVANIYQFKSNLGPRDILKGSMARARASSALRLVATRHVPCSTVRISSSTVRKMNAVHQRKLDFGTFPPSLEAANSAKTYQNPVCFFDVVKLETRLLLEQA